MKKINEKIVGVLVAGLMGASTVGYSYAVGSSGSQTYQYDDKTDAAAYAPVKVVGDIESDTGGAASGKITVSLPTTIAFHVNKNGVFTGSAMTVENRSTEPIKLSVENFTILDAAGISLVDYTGSGFPTLGRHILAMQLEGYIDSKKQTVKLLANAQYGDILKVAANGTGNILLVGEAGGTTTLATGDAGKAASEKVGSSGAKPEYKIVFKITKYTAPAAAQP
jgi:hypothetical protein